jgi:hypothetical protein
VVLKLRVYKYQIFSLSNNKKSIIYISIIHQNGPLKLVSYKFSVSLQYSMLESWVLQHMECFKRVTEVYQYFWWKNYWHIIIIIILVSSSSTLSLTGFLTLLRLLWNKWCPHNSAFNFQILVLSLLCAMSLAQLVMFPDSCSPLVTMLVAPVITGMTKHFIHRILWISVLRFFYFNFFQAPFVRGCIQSFRTGRLER